MFDYSKLKGRIVECYGSQSRFADAFGISKNSMSLKLCGTTSITQADICRMCKMLDIPNKEIGTYFFTNQVYKK